MSNTNVIDKHNNVIDYMKAIAIILMVFRHAGAPKIEIVEIFHMSLFFMVSGWCFSDKYTSNIKMVGKFILKKIQTLYIPFIIFNLCNVWTHNILLQINIYTGNPEFINNNPYGGNAYGLFPYKDLKSILWTTKEVLFFRGEYQLGGAAWFIRVLFWVTIIWCIVNYLIGKIFTNNKAVFAFNLCLASILLMFSYYCTLNHIVFKDGFEKVSSAYVMIFLGYYFRKTIPKITKVKDASIMLVISFIILECLYKFCGLMGWNSKIDDYNEPLLLLMTSTAGFFTIYSLAVLIDLTFSVKWLLVIGCNTMSIVLLHFLTFKIINIIYVTIHSLPGYLIAAFPILYQKWWFLYGLVGVCLPVFCSILYRKSKEVLQRKTIYKVLAGCLAMGMCFLIVRYNYANINNINVRYYNDFGYEWKYGHYDDGWLTDKSEMVVYNNLNENKYLRLNYFVIPELDGIEVTICDESREIVYFNKLSVGSGTIELPIKSLGTYVFSFNRNYNPSDAGINEDTRMLTILIDSIVVED